ncbi:hypothetical protein F4802DRAFT_443454 [Xylaria palmicola]|nr:hypothetical protein F4802DRAFT_443454 [Xylaria palmicola]
MASTFDQFVRFTTDAAGLERTFRLFHALSQILYAYALPLHLVTLVFGASAVRTRAVLLGLRGQLALARRHFRVFRSLESFGAARRLLYPPTPTPSAGGGRGPGVAVVGWDRWLDGLGRSFNGMYLLLEASTHLDALKVDGLAPWGPAWEAVLTVEGQRFWLFALACGVLANLVRVADVVAEASAPRAVQQGGGVEGKAVKERGNEKESLSASDDDEEKEEEGEKGAARDDHPVWGDPAVRAKIRTLARRALSDALDITIPGSIVGWIPAGAGGVGLAMFATTLLTSIDIWERCGREVAAADGKK